MDSVETNTSLGLSAGMARGELFMGLEGNTFLTKRFIMDLFLGTSLRKLSLGHFTPSVAVGASYDLFREFPDFTFGPSINSRFTSINYSKDQSSSLFEGAIGYQLIWGDRIKLLNGAYYGRGIESGPYTPVEYRTYWLTLGVLYELN